MRWKYSDPQHPAEYAQRSEISERMDAWWSEFRAKADWLEKSFRESNHEAVIAWMNDGLERVHPELAWEICPAPAPSRHCLVITCDAQDVLRPMVTDFVQRAPVVSGWKFEQWRPAVPSATAVDMVCSQLGLDLRNARFELADGDCRRIDVRVRCEELCSDEGGSVDEDVAFDGVFLLIEKLLGEHRVSRWLGRISISAEAVARATDTTDVAEFCDAFEARRSALLNAGPEDSFAARFEELQWAVVQLSPQSADDYAHRDDLLTAVTADPDLLGATFAAEQFSSERYSRAGETFCYLKIDGAETSEHGFRDRAELEDTVQRILTAAGSGSIVGGGTGLRYTYLELALTDVDAAIRALQAQLQKERIPRRSWLLFHDPDLAAEWVGMWPDSPVPPGFDEVG